MDGLSALPWTARWCQGTLPCPQSVDKRCRRSHGRVERLAMDGPLVSRYLTLPCRSVSLDKSFFKSVRGCRYAWKGVGIVDDACDGKLLEIRFRIDTLRRQRREGFARWQGNDEGFSIAYEVAGLERKKQGLAISCPLHKT